MFRSGRIFVYLLHTPHQPNVQVQRAEALQFTTTPTRVFCDDKRRAYKALSRRTDWLKLARCLRRGDTIWTWTPAVANIPKDAHRAYLLFKSLNIILVGPGYGPWTWPENVVELRDAIMGSGFIAASGRRASNVVYYCKPEPPADFQVIPQQYGPPRLCDAGGDYLSPQGVKQALVRFKQPEPLPPEA